MRLAKVLALVAGGWTAVAPAQSGSFERAVLAELNRARTQPQAVAADLRRYRNGFDGRVAREAGDPVGVLTQEGVSAVDEAIAFLDRQAPLPPLGEGSVLAHAAAGWAAAQGEGGGLGHGASPGLRVRAAGGDIYVGETISYGMATPAAVVRQFIVDDGQPRRGHRALLFSAGYRFAGIGCGGHARYRTMCVVDYAGTPDGGPVLPQVAAFQPSRAIAFNR